MPVAPLFVADMDTLKARLRLTGAAQPDALAQIDEAVEWVRVAIYDEEEGLGLSLVNELLGIPYVENATTLQDLRRTQANNLELAWVRLRLLCVMPTLFHDASGSSLDTWNEEPLTRRSERGLREMKAALEKEIRKGIADLTEDNDGRGSLAAQVFESGLPYFQPGSSIAPYKPRPE